MQAEKRFKHAFCSAGLTLVGHKITSAAPADALTVPQCFDGIELGGLSRGIDARYNSYEERDC